ncbi:ABC transporter substrate-binding protein [Streptomyces sp. NBC_00344]|uniref:ABC transporter substrate-binding protein n=1 Tax=Streptomyces sp. NBC_00344 TaxID=2975720 RepID=UPI002E2373B0
MIDWFREFFWYTALRRIVTSVVVLVLLAAAGVAGYALYTPDLHCAKGVDRPEKGAECIGVNGEGYDFGMPALTDVARAIQRENKRVAGTKYATVALLLPLTTADGSMQDKVLHDVQGAFLEQYRANEDPTDGRLPKIRLVLANSGTGNAHADDVVRRLERMTGDPDRLRAVSGVATSDRATKAAVRELTGHHIPVVGSTISADDLANGPGNPFPGLARVSPTNTDEAAALAGYSAVAPEKAVLVYDDGTDDNYITTLKKAFVRMLKGTPNDSQSFTSPADRSQEGDTAVPLAKIAALVCDDMRSTDTVYFAGRHTQLRQFVNQLGRLRCNDRPMTVITGDEGSYLSRDTKLDRSAFDSRNGKSTVTVRYAALAHPDAWQAVKARSGGKDVHPPATGGDETTFKPFHDLIVKAAGSKVGPIGAADGKPLTDGQAIVAYDAMATAVQGIRTAADGKLPTLSQVGSQWRYVQGRTHRVNGVSGWICLDKYGNPYDKAVPIVKLGKDGSPVFVKIAWPTKKLPDQDCLTHTDS